MKTLYFECKMGAAGDMLMAALYEICDQKELFLQTMNQHHAFVGQEQNDFNRLQYQKVCKPTEGMKGSAKKSTM